MSYQMAELVRDCTTAPDGHEFTPAEKLVLLLLGTYYNVDEGAAFPSLSRLANEAAVSRRQVIRILDSLVTHGCIAKDTRERAYGGFKNNFYIFDPAFIGNEACKEPLARSKWSAPGGPPSDTHVTSAGSPTLDSNNLQQVVPTSLSSDIGDPELVTPTPPPSDIQGSPSDTHTTLNGTLETERFSKREKRHSSSEPEASLSLSPNEPSPAPAAPKKREMDMSYAFEAFERELKRPPEDFEKESIRTICSTTDGQNRLFFALELARWIAEDGRGTVDWVLEKYSEDVFLGEKLWWEEKEHRERAAETIEAAAS